MRKKVFICSPFRGDMEGNARKAAAYCRMACEQGFLPVAPHLLFPQFLNEGIEEERRLGIAMGMELLSLCDEVWVFGEATEGMAAEIASATEQGKTIIFMERSVCSDGRGHGMLMFCGANRTSRWSGKIVQIQNLPKNYLPDLELARELVKQGRFEDIELLYDSTPNVLSELIRTAFIPKLGCRFVVADFSAIEARVLAWLSGEQWRLDVFTSHGKIYEACGALF